MAGVPDRDTLLNMKRADLQRLCKDHGLKANLKSDALIDLLLDTPSGSSAQAQTSQPSQPPPPPAQRPPSSRIVSRTAGTRSRQHSSSSIIIHSDTEGADEQPTEPEPVEQQSAAQNGPSTRTRKAKDSQLRLGVGRPTMAGGAGARAVTQAVGTSKLKRGKGHKGLKPPEDTIPEEVTSENLAEDLPDIIQPVPMSVDDDKPMDINLDISPSQRTLHALVEEQVKPLRNAISALQEQLQQQATAHSSQLMSLQHRIDGLTAELAGTRISSDTLSEMGNSLQRLQADFVKLQPRPGPDSPHSLPIASSSSQRLTESGFSPLPASSTKTSVQSAAATARPSFRPSPVFEYPPAPARSPAKAAIVEASQARLGKRHREDASHIPGIIDASEASTMRPEDLRRVVIRPDRKRVKTDEDDQRELFNLPEPVAGPSSQIPQDPHIVHSTPPPPRHSRFTVFTGPEESDYPHIPQPELEEDIFNERDMVFFDAGAQIPPRPAGPQGPITSTANAVENQNPFHFGFPLTGQLPITSTPAPSGTAPAIDDSPFSNHLPFPERPQSPSPAPSRINRGGRIERNDRFHPFGTPPPPTSRAPSGSTQDSVSAFDPSALLRTPPAPTLPDLVDLDEDGQPARGAGKASSNDVGTGLGMTAVHEAPAGSMRRTMYGTELQDDTRFGDFGVEGVASGYWGPGSSS